MLIKMTTTLKPQIDIEFTSTSLYRKYSTFYNNIESSHIGPNIENQLTSNVIYPIKFTPISPLYFIRIVNANKQTTAKSSSLKIQAFIRHFQYNKCNAKKIVGENQLLLATRSLIISKNIFVSLLLLTESGDWSVIPVIRDDIKLKRCMVEILSITEYCNYAANVKCKQMNLPFRRLPGSLSFKNFNKIAENLTRDINTEDLFNQRNFVSYWKGHFNLNSSLSHIRTHPTLNGALRMDSENAVEIPKETIHSESTMKPNASNNRKKRGRPSFKKENENNSDNVDKSSKNSSKPSHLENNEENNEDINEGKNTEELKISSERTLRKRKNRHKSDNSDKSSDSESSEKHAHKDTESSNDDRDKNDNEYIGRADSQPRRSSRRIAVISSKKLAKGVQNNQKNENEETASKSTESVSVSDYSKRNTRPGSFKKKAVEVLSRWNTEEEFKHEYNKFYHAATNHLPRIPKMGWLEVDIYKLFKITISKGGYHEVTKKLLWKDVYKSLNNTNIVSNAATTIRSHYRKLLLNFEDSIFRPRDKNSNETLNKTEPGSSQSKDIKKESRDTPPHDPYNSFQPIPAIMRKYKEFTIDSIINGQKEVSRSSDSMARYSDVLCPGVIDPSYYNPMAMPPPFDDQRRNIPFNPEGPPFPGFFEYGNNYRPNYYGPPCHPPMSPYHMERMNSPEFQHRPYLPPMFDNYDAPRYYNPNGPYPGHYMPPPPPPPPHHNFPSYPNGYSSYPYENPPNNFPPHDRYFPNKYNNMYPPFNRSPPQNR